MQIDLRNVKSVNGAGEVEIVKVMQGRKELWPDYQSYVLYDWIQNTSPAYLNTGINPRGEWRYELKVRFNSTLKTNN